MLCSIEPYMCFKRRQKLQLEDFQGPVLNYSKNWEKTFVFDV